MTAVPQASRPFIPPNAQTREAVSAPSAPGELRFVDELMRAATSGKASGAVTPAARQGGVAPEPQPRTAHQPRGTRPSRGEAPEPQPDSAEAPAASATADGGGRAPVKQTPPTDTDAADTPPGQAATTTDAQGDATAGPQTDALGAQQNASTGGGALAAPLPAVEPAPAGKAAAATPAGAEVPPACAPPTEAAPAGDGPLSAQCAAAGPQGPFAGLLDAVGDASAESGDDAGNSVGAPAGNDSAAVPGPSAAHALLAGAGEATPAARAAAEAPGAQQPSAAALPPEVEFEQANHPEIVSAIVSHGAGGSHAMRIRLNPPELGAVIVRVDMRDGELAASFQTSSDEAATLLGHTLGRLRQTLETHGISVRNLDVRHTPTENRADAGGERQYQQPAQQEFHHHQRRHLLRQLWQRLAGDRYVLDVVA